MTVGKTIELHRLIEDPEDAPVLVLSPAAHLANVESPEAMTGAILDHLQPAPREGI